MIAIVSGLIVACGFPGADLGAIVPLGVGLFLAGMPIGRAKNAFGYGFLFGFTFFAALLYWIAVFTFHVIGLLGILAWILSAGIQAAFIGLFALATNFVWPRLASWGRILAVPSLWVLCEWLRQLGTFGMGWGDLAYTQWHCWAFRDLAPFTGIWAISWILVAFGVILAQLPRKFIVPYIVACMLVPLLFSDSYVTMPARLRSPVAASIQANINQDVAWVGARPEDPAYYKMTMDTLGGMIHDAATKDGATLCVLAETAIPGYPMSDRQLHDQVTSWAVDNHVTIVGGARYIDVRAQKDQNVVFEVSPTGHWSGPYAKTRLVPFGEYVPYRRFFPFLEALHVAVFDMKAGATDQPALNAPGSLWRVGPMICYESAFAGYARQQTLGGATVLAIVTDDTWFGRTAAAQQHNAMAAMRAAETHRPLVRCGATGISAIYDEHGRELRQLGIFNKGIVASAISPQTDMTPYVRFGDWFVGLCGLVVVVVAGVSLRKTPEPATERAT